MKNAVILIGTLVLLLIVLLCWAEPDLNNCTVGNTLKECVGQAIKQNDKILSLMDKLLEESARDDEIKVTTYFSQAEPIEEEPKEKPKEEIQEPKDETSDEEEEFMEYYDEDEESILVGNDNIPSCTDEDTGFTYYGEVQGLLPKVSSQAILVDDNSDGVSSMGPCELYGIVK